MILFTFFSTLSALFLVASAKIELGCIQTGAHTPCNVVCESSNMILVNYTGFDDLSTENGLVRVRQLWDDGVDGFSEPSFAVNDNGSFSFSTVSQAGAVFEVKLFDKRVLDAKYKLSSSAASSMSAAYPSGAQYTDSYEYDWDACLQDDNCGTYNCPTVVTKTCGKCPEELPDWVDGRVDECTQTSWPQDSCNYDPYFEDLDTC